jgi:hypothetical protein
MVLVVGLGARLAATQINQVQEAFDSAIYFSYEHIYNNKAFTDISSAIVYQASLSIGLFDGTTALETSGIFVPLGQNLVSFENPKEFLCSELFLSTLDTGFTLRTEEEAIQFLSLLYLIDDEYFHDGYYRTGQKWYFVRDEFFGDIEMWVVTTDEQGHIKSIEYAYEEEATLPTELKGAFTQDEYDDNPQQVMISESNLKLMRRTLEESLRYDLCVQEFDDSILSQLWEGIWYSLDVTTEVQEDDGFMYSVTSFYYAYVLDQEVYLFGTLPAALENCVVMNSMQASFSFETEQQAILFEQALGVLERDTQAWEDRFLLGTDWYFIKESWFDEGQGYVATIDDSNRLAAVRYEYLIPLDTEESSDSLMETQQDFDSSLVDWTLTLLEPATPEVTLIEGQGLSVAIEFDAYAASQMGAWMLTLLDGEMFGMNYNSEGLTSPYYDWIELDLLSLGKHTISYLLMMPGMDIDNPLGRIDIETEILAFDAPQGIWNLHRLLPQTEEVEISEGSSATIQVAFDDAATKQYGVNLAIRYQGEIVGGQNSMYLESPFETTVPESILNKGTHRVDILLVRPGGTDQPPLAECGATFHVQ